MLDLDDLKPVNDTFGHQWGDRLLKAIADAIRHTIRFTDAAARYGGDEFVVLLPETDVAGGYVVGEKLRRDIAAMTLHAADRNVRSSVSVGLVSYPDDGTTIEQLVAAADVAMYESKRRGKNRIVGYQTRTERVATAMDSAQSADLVQLTPASDARTGGDPAPWYPVSPEGGARVSYGEYPVSEAPLEPPSRRSSDRSSIPVEPERDMAPPWTTDAAPRSAPPPPPRPDDAPYPTDEPPISGSYGRRDPPPEPPGRPPTEVGIDEQPWLTRTDAASGPPAPPGTGRAQPDDDPRSDQAQIHVPVVARAVAATRFAPVVNAPGSRCPSSLMIPTKNPEARSRQADEQRR